MNPRSGVSSAVTALILGLAAHSGPAVAQTPGADTAGMYEAARRFSAAYMRGDADALTALYTDDAVIFPERSDAISGRDAIRKYWAPAGGQRITRHQLTPTRVEQRTKAGQLTRAWVRTVTRSCMAPVKVTHNGDPASFGLLRQAGG